MIRAKELRALVFNTARQAAESAPRCRHFGECGGCSFQDRAYDGQVAAKLLGLQTIWADESLPLELPPPMVVPSPESYGYRTRMDYVASRGRFGLRRRQKFNSIIDLEECHLLPPNGLPVARAVWQALTAAGLSDYDVKKHQGFLRYLVVRRSPDDRLMLAAVTAADAHGPAVEQAALAALEHQDVASFWWLLNDTLTDMSFGTPLRHWGAPTLTMPVGPWRFEIGPNTFFQNNTYLLNRLLDDVAEALLPDTPLADLYGGVGTIAICLSDRVPMVVSVESVTESANLAAQNIADNGTLHVFSVCQDVLAFLRAQEPGSLPQVVADPPRIGMGPEVCRELLRIAPQRLIYISCNPITQREDLRILSEKFYPTLLRGYDMFPQTPHLETLMVLVPKSML